MAATSAREKVLRSSCCKASSSAETAEVPSLAARSKSFRLDLVDDLLQDTAFLGAQACRQKRAQVVLPEIGLALCREKVEDLAEGRGREDDELAVAREATLARQEVVEPLERLGRRPWARRRAPRLAQALRPLSGRGRRRQGQQRETEREIQDYVTTEGTTQRPRNPACEPHLAVLSRVSLKKYPIAVYHDQRCSSTPPPPRQPFRNLVPRGRGKRPAGGVLRSCWSVRVGRVSSRRAIWGLFLR